MNLKKWIDKRNIPQEILDGIREIKAYKAGHKKLKTYELNHRKENPTMLLNKSSTRQWLPTDYPGIERSLFRNNDTGGRSSVVRLVKGAQFPRHAHHGTEEVVVLSGQVSIGGVAMEQGDYLFTTPGEEHDVIALTDAVIFVSSQKATPIVGT